MTLPRRPEKGPFYGPGISDSGKNVKVSLPTCLGSIVPGLPRGAQTMTYREMLRRSSLSDVICLLAVAAALFWLVFLRR
jgi:hypothetical protein